MLRLWAVLALLFTGAASAAQAGPVCDGRYGPAQEMLDVAFGRFGTIYTGGPVASYSDADVGPTIDLWRLWRGLPDLRFRDAQDFDYMGDWGRDYSGFGWSADDLTLILRIAQRPQPTGLTEALRYVAARYLNKMVDAGSAPGWWLAPGPTDQTERQKLVMAAAVPGSLMEWLMVMMAQSDTPQAVAWTNEGNWDSMGSYRHDLDAYRLRSLVRVRRKSEPGLEWQVAAILLGDDKTAFSRKVQDCSASQAEYAAYAVGIYEDLRRNAHGPDLGMLDDLPEQMRLRAMGNLALVAVRDIGTDGEDDDARARLDWIAAHSPTPEFLVWLNAGRDFAAQSPQDLIALHDGLRLDWRTVDALNLLSLKDLALFASKAALGLEDQRRLFTVVAARAFVLGDQMLARQFLTALRPLMPNYADVIDQALAGPGGAEVQNARALLALPRPTVWLQAHDDEDMDFAKNAYRFSAIDLPLRFVSAGVMNRDLASWMVQPFAETRRFWTAADRAWRRGRHFHGRSPQPFVPDDWEYRDGYPFLRLIAWDELGRLDQCHGLTARLSAVLVNWVDRGSDSWLDRLLTDDSAFPEVLARVIQLNRRSPGALLDGKPAGQRAFALLSTRFGESHAAQATRYWYFQDRGCRG